MTPNDSCQRYRASLRSSGHSLLLLLHLPLAFLLQVLLLSLGVERGQLLITLGLLGSFALIVALLGFLLQIRLLDLPGRLVAHALDLAQDFGSEVGIPGELIRQADGVLEDGQERLVVVVRREAVLEDDSLAGGCLIKAGNS